MQLTSRPVLIATLAGVLALTRPVPLTAQSDAAVKDQPKKLVSGGALSKFHYRGKIAELMEDSAFMGEDWYNGPTLVVKDFKEVGSLTLKEIDEIQKRGLMADFRPGRLSAFAELVHMRKPTDGKGGREVTMRMYVFEDVVACRTWWRRSFKGEYWERKYVLINGIAEMAAFYRGLQKISVRAGNVIMTSHQPQGGSNDYLQVVRHYMMKIGVQMPPLEKLERTKKMAVDNALVPSQSDYKGDLESLSRDPRFLGEGWFVEPQSFFLNDIRDWSRLPRAYHAQFQKMSAALSPYGVKGLGRLHYYREGRLRSISVNIFTFHTNLACQQWWEARFNQPDTEKIYARLPDIGDDAVVARGLRKLFIRKGNVCVAATQQHHDESYVKAVRHFMNQFKVELPELDALVEVVKKARGVDEDDDGSS